MYICTHMYTQMEIGLKQLRGAYLPNRRSELQKAPRNEVRCRLGDRHPGVALALSPSGVNDHLKNLRRMKFFFEIFGLKCVSDHSKSIPEKKIFFEIFSILDPRKWPHNEPKWTKTPKTARKIFFPYIFFL